MNGRRALAGMAALALGAAACGPGQSAAPTGAGATTSATAAATSAATSAASAGSTAAASAAAIGPGEGELNLVIWAGYAERGAVDPAYDWVTPFEERTGCIVKTTDQTDSANGVSLMQSGQYDGGAFSGNATERLMASGLAAPVNLDLFENYDKLFDGLKMKAHNSKDGVAYGVPHGRGPNLLIYNTEEVTPAPTSWDPIWEGGADYEGKISIYNSADFIADAALHLMVKQPALGITNPYQLNEAQFEAAIDLLEQLDANNPLYWGAYTDQMQSFGSGETVIGTSWQFQVNLLQGEDRPIEGITPAEGSTGWSDTWMVHAQAKNPNCMLMWMEHMMSAEANGMATVWFGEAPTSPEACAFAETLSPGHCDLTHATDEAYYDKIWYWATPREDCGDTDPATSCKDQDDWIEAWTTITGS